LSRVVHERPSKSVISASSNDGVTDALAAAPFAAAGTDAVLAAGDGLGEPFVAIPIDGNAMPVPPATIFVDTFEVLGDGERDGGGEGRSGAWKT
jgi:hypothetical protein